MEEICKFRGIFLEAVCKINVLIYSELQEPVIGLREQT